MKIASTFVLEDKKVYIIPILSFVNGEDDRVTKEGIIELTGKELKRIETLINMFNKLQDNPAPMAGFGDMLGMLKNFGDK